MKFKVLNLPNANVSSVLFWLKRCGFEGEVLELCEDQIPADSFVILPGVGSFDFVMELLVANKMDKKLRDHVANSGFVLGICLGMQILFESSSEGILDGLGLMKGKLTKLPHGKMNVPNVGWRTLENGKGSSRFSNEHFYFTHSYCLLENEIASSVCELALSLSNKKFLAFLREGNVFCTQFHPEKSGKSGVHFLRNIVHENASNS